MDPVSQLRLLGGTARVSDLLAVGYTKPRLHRAIEEGRISRLKHGLLTLPDGNLLIRHAVSNGGLLSCASAVKELGLWGLKDPEGPHLWVPHGRPVDYFRHAGSTAETVRHRGTLAGNKRPGAYAPVLDVVLHALRCRPPLEALVIAESAVVKRKLRLHDLLSHLPGPRNGPFRALLERVDSTAESPLETIARELFRKAGLRVESQVRIEGVGRVDLLIEGRVIVELDGFDFHWTRPMFRKDRHRNNAGMLRGHLTLRYVYEDLVFEPDTVVAQVLSLARQVA
jgi:very-short-patch-repair endonuclease